MNITDILDDYVFGPLNIINRIQGVFKELQYGDRSVQFSLVRLDKGGSHGFRDVQSMLKKYGIDVFGITHDSQCLHFRVKQRQAVWAEYLLLSAGIKLKMHKLIEPKNETYVTSRELGEMPTAWADRPKRRRKSKVRGYDLLGKLMQW